MKTCIKFLSIAVITIIINACVPNGGGVSPSPNLVGKINMINPYSPEVRNDLSKYIYDSSGNFLRIEYQIDNKVVRTATISENNDSILIIDTDGGLLGQASPDATYHIEIRKIPNTNYISSIIAVMDNYGSLSYSNTYVNYSSLGKVSSISRESNISQYDAYLSDFIYDGNRLIRYSSLDNFYDPTQSKKTEIIYDSIYLRKKCTPQNIDLFPSMSEFNFYGNFLYDGSNELTFGIQDPYMVKNHKSYVKNSYTNYEWIPSSSTDIMINNYTNNLVNINWLGIIYNY